MLRVAFALLVLSVAATYGERVSCRDTGNGFDCVSVVPVQELTAQNLYVLWLKSGRQGGDQSLDIQVPNYKIADVIQAAAKGGDSHSKTAINVNLARPEFSYTAQKEEKVGQTSQSFDVNLQYDRVNGRAVHFADDGAGSERYAPLSGSIKEP